MVRTVPSVWLAGTVTVRGVRPGEWHVTDATPAAEPGEPLGAVAWRWQQLRSAWRRGPRICVSFLHAGVRRYGMARVTLRAGRGATPALVRAVGDGPLVDAADLLVCTHCGQVLPIRRLVLEIPCLCGGVTRFAAPAARPPAPAPTVTWTAADRRWLARIRIRLDDAGAGRC